MTRNQATKSMTSYLGQELQDGEQKSPTFYPLVVSPGITNAPRSKAAGDSITASTAGIIGTILITATEMHLATVDQVETQWHPVQGPMK